MRVLKFACVVGALLAGSVGIAGHAAASPPVAAAMPVAKAGHGLTVKADYRYGHGGYRAVSPRRPWGPAYRAYRPYPRVVCHTRYRAVRTAYGAFRSRPVQVCTRRW